jgi:hypothetical protein
MNLRQRYLPGGGEAPYPNPPSRRDLTNGGWGAAKPPISGISFGPLEPPKADKSKISGSGEGGGTFVLEVRITTSTNNLSPTRGLIFGFRYDGALDYATRVKLR